MFRMFNRTETGAKLLDEPRFTRFEDRASGRYPDGAKPAFTRRAVPEVTVPPRASTPSLTDLLAEDRAVRQRIRTPSEPAAPVVNDTAHLHAEDHIPLWVIRNALPQRFAAMHRDADTFDFQ